MEFSHYLKTYQNPDRPDTVLVYSTLRGSLITAPLSLLQRAADGGASEPESQTLARLGILVPDAAAEREQLRDIFRHSERMARTYTAVVALNLDCNLACGYCYEDHFRGSKYMSEATADLLVQKLSDERGMAAGKDLRIDFYGGEALLSVPTIRRISTLLREAVLKRGNSYSFTLVTNGTLLTRGIVEELLPLGLELVRTTLDGPREVHDRQRPFVSGAGSFGRIVSNLKEVCDLVPVQVGGNFAADNYRRFPELLDHLLEEGITGKRLAGVNFTPISPSAGEAGLSDFGHGCACSGEPWLVEASLFLREEILKRGFPTPKPKAAGCMVEVSHEIVVGYDGALYKCPAFMGWPDLKIGTLAEGVGDYSESHDLGHWDREECLECAYLPLCFGGCRYLQRLVTGSVQGVECRRPFLEAALETILRQDLRLR